MSHCSNRTRRCRRAAKSSASRCTPYRDTGCTHQHRVGHRRQPHLRRAALDVDLVVDASRYFEVSNRLGIRATIRVAFGYPHEAAIVRIAPEPGT